MPEKKLSIKLIFFLYSSSTIIYKIINNIVFHNKKKLMPFKVIFNVAPVQINLIRRKILFNPIDLIVFSR
jgi:hypothetical protein